MTGTLANSAAILAGGGLGLLLRRRFSERYKTITVQAVSLCVVLIGLQMAFKADNVIILLSSMTLGGLLGEFIGIEARLEALGAALKRWAKSEHSDFVSGFVTASLIFCVGSMAVVGSIEDGVHGDPTILYAKAFIDGVFAMAATTTMGIGVPFSAFSVLVYQSALTLCAGRLSAFMTPQVLNSLSAAGGLLIFGIGLNIMELARIRVGNLLPAIFIAALLRYYF